MSKGNLSAQATRLDQGSGGATGQRGWRIAQPMDRDRGRTKIGIVETVATLFRRRAGRAKPDDLERIMQKVPDAPVEPEDMIPPGLAEPLSRLK